MVSYEVLRFSPDAELEAFVRDWQTCKDDPRKGHGDVMNMEFDEILATVDTLDAEELTIWIESGWVRPEETVPAPKFSAVDVARVRLSHE